MAEPLDLSPFIGSESSWDHWCGRFAYTEGVKYVADHAERRYWLLDAIGSYQHECDKDPMLREFQLWKLELDGKGMPH